MTSSRRFGRLLQAGCLGFIGMLAAAGCGGSSSPKPDGSPIDGPFNPDGQSLPGLTVSPSQLDFKTVDVGVTSSPLTVTVTNNGNTATGPLNVTTTGSGIVAAGTCSGPLAPKATCTISVTVQPAAAGAFIGSVKVGGQDIAVFGTGVLGGQFSLTPTSLLDLGPVPAGKPASGIVVMANTDPAHPLSKIVIGISGPGFALGTGATPCGEALEINGVCNIYVTFTSATSGPAKGSLTVSQGGVTKIVGLSALVQTPAKLKINPTTASIPSVAGTPSSPIPFYVTNSGDIASAVPVVTIGGANKDDFSITGNTCVTALPGGALSSCQITVVYTPKATATTNSSASLTVAEPGTGGSSDTANLTGTPTAPGALTITGAPTDFGPVTVGTTSAALTFTVAYNGTTSSGALKLSGTPSQFIVSTNCDDKDLAPKATCIFTAQFKPAADDALAITGQLKALGANVLNPGIIAVTGTPVPPAKLAIEPLVLDFGAWPFLQESGPKTLTISNVGAAPTGALKVENTGAQFNVKGTTCEGAVLTATGATKSCTVTVTFTASGTTVDATGSIVVRDTTGAAGSVSATLHGTGIERPDVTISPIKVCPESGDADCKPASGDQFFKNMVVGKASPEVTFVVTNTTDPGKAADSGTLNFAFSGDALAEFAIVKNNCTAPLQSTSSGTSCVVTVAFTPAAVGLRKALLTLTTSRGGIATATLEGKGVSVVELVPLLSDTDIANKVTGLDLGSTPLGKTGNYRYYRVWVRDSSATDHTTTVTVALPTPSLPDFVWPSGTNPCTGKTLDVSSTTSPQNGYTKDAGYWYCDFPVLFSPKSAKGVLSADLTASATGGGSSKLTLTGTATGPLVVGVGGTFIKPAIIDTPVAVGMSSEITLTITNKGIVAQNGLTFGLSGTGSDNFQIIGTTCWGIDGMVSHHTYATLKAVTLDPLATCTVTVGFAPQTESKYSVTFTVTAANAAGATDDESDTVNIIASAASTFGSLTVTPNPATTQFGDVAEGSTTATPVTFTVTNTGTLPAKGLTVGSLTQYEVLPSTGVAGACTLNDSTFVLAGSAPCTIRVRPRPTTSVPAGTKKTAVSNESLTVSTLFGDQTVAVAVPMLYYVTSSIVVKDTGTSSTSIAYAFPAAGLATVQKHNFVVTNIGSTAATLVANVAAPFAVEAVPTGTFDPPACVYTASGLAAGASCTLVLQNLNSSAGELKDVLLSLSDSGKAGRATVNLSKTTLTDSAVTLQYLESSPIISLGSVPADSTTASFVGGKATVWYKNAGQIPTAALSFRWDAKAAGTADSEFIIDSDETSCVGKVLQPEATCSMSIHFKFDAVNGPALDTLRTRVLKVMDGAKESPVVTFTATATPTASLYIDDQGTPVKDGFFAFPGVTAQGVASAAKTFRIVNASGATKTFTLPAAGDPINEDAVDFIIATTQPSSGACVLGATETLDTAKSSCLFNVAFKPATTSPVFKHDSITVGTAVLGLMGKVQQPVTLVLTPASADFGTVAAGATADRSFTVTNVGDVPMAADQVSLSTSVGTATAATYAITADACNASRLAAGASCVITVRATGVTYAAAAQTASLTVSNTPYLGSSPLTSSLTVMAKNAATIGLAGSGTFGNVPVTGQADLTFEVSNVANAVSTGVVAASLSGKDAAQFSVVSSTCATDAGLAGGATCEVKVRFQPTALSSDGNDLVAVLSVTGTPGGTKTVGLTGTPVTALTISPAGPVDLGSSALQVFTVALASTATATMPLKTSLVGADFMVVADECYAQVLSAATSSCKLSVKYIGTTSGTKKSATLTVDGGSVAKKASVVINATSVQAESH